MDTSLMQTLGKIARIGGLGLGVFLILFREIIRKQIFPKLKEESAFSLIRQFMYLTFSISVLGILAWVWTEAKQTDSMQTKTETGQTRTDTPLRNVVKPNASSPAPHLAGAEGTIAKDNDRGLAVADKHDHVLLIVKLRPPSPPDGVVVSVDGKVVATINGGRTEGSIILPIYYSNKEVVVEVSARDHYPIYQHIRLEADRPTTVSVDF